MRKLLGLAVLAFLLFGLFGAGLYGLGEALAEGESPIPALLAIAIPLLAVGFTVAWALGRLVRPLREGPAAATIRGLVVLVVAGSLEAGAYLSVAETPVQRPDAVVTAAVAPACRNTPVTAAGALNSGGRINHLVILDTQGAEFGWTGKPDIAWRPATIDDVELVACIQPEETFDVVEVCSYNGPSVTRYSATRQVTVVEARTGRTLADLTVTSQPNPCPGALARDVTEIRASLDWWEVETHLASLVEHGTYVNPDAEPSQWPESTPGPGASEEPADGPTATTLLAAIKDGLLGVKVRGDSLQYMDLTLTSRATEAIEVTIPIGTRFQPRTASVQTMVVIAPSTVELGPGEEVTVTVDVACAQMHDAQPGANGKANGFDVVTKPVGTALRKLLLSDRFAAADFRVQQFAIWTITDNPTRRGYVHLGYLGVGSGPSTSELRQIKAMFVAAGLAPANYRALR